MELLHRSRRTVREVRRKVVFLLFYLFAFLPLPAGAQGIPFIRNYTADDYRANKLNYDVETDKNGNVFVANFE